LCSHHVLIRFSKFPMCSPRGVLNSTSLFNAVFFFWVSKMYFFYKLTLGYSSWTRVLRNSLEGAGRGALLSFVVEGAAGDTCSLCVLSDTSPVSHSSLARSLLDNTVTCLVAQISFVCDAIFLATISPNFASWCQSANGRSIRRLYSFSCFFFPLLALALNLSRQQVIEFVTPSIFRLRFLFLIFLAVHSTQLICSSC
jgi:hypothetical protein